MKMGQEVNDWNFVRRESISCKADDAFRVSLVLRGQTEIDMNQRSWLES